MNTTAQVKTVKGENGVILSVDGLYWFKPVTRAPHTRTVVRYEVIRRSDRVVVCSGTTVTAAARILAAKLAA